MSRFDRIDRQMNTFHDMVDRLGIDPIDLARDCLGYRLATAVTLRVRCRRSLPRVA